jgi:hypothetical protein
MLARRRTTILPAMTLPEAIDTTRIPRVAGRTGDRLAWVTTRPCRAPHHTISDAGLIGGGQVPMPGEVSLAHHGVLVLDERPESRRQVLEEQRQWLEESRTSRSSRGRAGWPYCDPLLNRASLGSCGVVSPGSWAPADGFTPSTGFHRDRPHTISESVPCWTTRRPGRIHGRSPRMQSAWRGSAASQQCR